MIHDELGGEDRVTRLRRLECGDAALTAALEQLDTSRANAEAAVGAYCGPIGPAYVRRFESAIGAVERGAACKEACNKLFRRMLPTAGGSLLSGEQANKPTSARGGSSSGLAAAVASGALLSSAKSLLRHRHHQANLAQAHSKSHEPSASAPQRGDFVDETLPLSLSRTATEHLPQPPAAPRLTVRPPPRSLRSRLSSALLSPRVNSATSRAAKQAMREQRRVAAIKLQAGFRGWRERARARSMTALVAQQMRAGMADIMGSWYYRDDAGRMQGPFASAQISEWYEAGYLPPALEMRSSEDPEGAFTTLLQLCASAPNGKPPFVQLRDHVRDRSLSASMSARN